MDKKRGIINSGGPSDLVFMERRTFNKLLLGFAAYKIADTLGVVADVQATYAFLKSVLVEPAIDADVKAAAYDLFRLNSYHTSIVPAASNPAVRQKLLKYKGEPTTLDRDDLLKYFSVATVDAASSIASLLVGSSNDRILDYKGVQHLVKADPTAPILALGTPTSNELIRVLMQYQEIGGGQLGHEFLPDDGIFFPIRFALNAQTILSHPEKRDRYYLGRSKSGDGDVIPNWGLEFWDGRILLPKTDGMGRLLEDFLVISCIPNWLEPRALEAETPIVCIGGTHGVGTTAISNLIQNPAVLPQLQKALSDIGSPKFWQAVIRVELDGPGGKIAQLVLEREMMYRLEYDIPLLFRRHNT